MFFFSEQKNSLVRAKYLFGTPGARSEELRAREARAVQSELAARDARAVQSELEATKAENYQLRAEVGWLERAAPARRKGPARRGAAG